MSGRFVTAASTMAEQAASKAQSNPHYSSREPNFSSLTYAKCALANRIPAVPKGLAVAERGASETNRVALVKVIDVLYNIPHIRQKTVVWLEAQVDELRARHANAEADVCLWPDLVKSVGKVFWQRRLNHQEVNYISSWLSGLCVQKAVR